jgi:lysophospholipase L1-like esterase
MRRWLAVFVVLFPACAWAGNLATAPIDRLNLPWWQERWEASLADAQAHPDARIVWLGDSITQFWQLQGGHGYDDILPVWQKYYAPYGAVDFGFKGDTTSSLIWRLDHGQVAGLHPDVAIILIGANNFGRVHWDAGMTVPGIRAVVEKTEKLLPGAHVLLLSVLPSIRSPWVDAQTAATNAALAARYRGDDRVTFVDVTGIFETDGVVNADLFIDPKLSPPEPALHPDAAGMTRIAQALAPEVARWVR